mmetsp:Transcript_53131/g.123692  ORF Transcript_53131/g.123692 Transcript_53131/m.123692 type:complete len:354 (-) Transcript_53131:15-1076(-)
MLQIEDLQFLAAALTAQACTAEALAATGSPPAPDEITAVLSVVQNLEEHALPTVRRALWAIGTKQDSITSQRSATSAMRPNTDIEDEDGGASVEPPSIVFDHPHVFAVAKPPEWTVSVEHLERHLGHGSDDLSAGRPLQHWLSSKMPRPIVLDSAVQHGIVHRLDRETSGLVLCAKTYAGYYLAQIAFAVRRVTKAYVCVCCRHMDMASRRVEAPLRVVGRPGAWRSVVDPIRGRPACTQVTSVALLAHGAEPFSLVDVELLTGRLHQIRAHLASIGHPLLGDIVYGGFGRPWCPRVFLHAGHLSVDLGTDVPELPASVEVRCPLPRDLRAALACLSPDSEDAEGALRKWLGE